MLAFIATDLDEEIDDQCALEYLFRHMKLQTAREDGGRLIILLVGGKPVPHAEWLVLAERRLQVFWKYFPEYADEQEFSVGAWDVSVFLPDQWAMWWTGVATLPGPAMTIDVFLQIAPLCGVPPAFFEQHNIRQRVLMGDFEKPEKSINGKKTWIGLGDEEVVSHFNAEFDAQEAAMKAGGTKTVWIGTDVARKAKFTPRMLAQLRPGFRNMIMGKAFEQFVGRIPPSRPYCLSVSRDANLPTCLGYFRGQSDAAMAGLTPDEILEQFKTTGERFWVSQAGPLQDPVFTERDHLRLYARINELTVSFVRAMRLAKFEECTKAHECFSDIAWIVAAITRESYGDQAAGDDVFTMGNLENVADAKRRWLEWVELHQCSLTPCYDLQAAYKALPFMLYSCFQAVDYEVEETEIPEMVGWLESSEGWGGSEAWEVTEM